jgi:hypothetical protein
MISISCFIYQLLSPNAHCPKVIIKQFLIISKYVWVHKSSYWKLSSAFKWGNNSVQFNSFKFICDYLDTYDVLFLVPFFVDCCCILYRFFLFTFCSCAILLRKQKTAKKATRKLLKKKIKGNFADNCRMYDECMVKWMSVEVRWSEAVEVQE